MDVYQNVTVDGGLPPEFQKEKKVPSSGSSPSISKLEEFFPGENQEADDFSVQWLSILVEDCLSSRTNCTSITTTKTPHKPHQPPKPQNLTPQFETPSKSRTKRRKLTPNTTLYGSPTEPPLLHDIHAFWLADSELIVPKKTTEETSATPSPKQVVSECEEVEEEEKVAVQPRRCTHCLSHRTPQWRAGPLGPKTLCNACGVRFKSGRLLPEYRPAKSPTFVSYKHSNSHKKVMEMRMAIKVSSHSK